MNAEPLHLAHATVVDALAHHAQAHGDQPALVGLDGAVLTWRELAAAVDTTAAGLARLDVLAGDRVGLSCDPSIATVVAYLGLLRAGAVVVPANTAYTERELGHIVADAAPTLAIVDDAARGERWRAAGLDAVLAPTDLTVASTSAGATLAHPSPDAPAMVGYTSGTTGSPKGAVLSHRNLAAGAASVVQAWEWTSTDTLVLALPLFHMHGLGVGINGTVLAGATAVVLPRFTADDVCDAVGRHDASLFFGVPTMYARLADTSRCAELARLRIAISGSAPLPAAVWQRLHDVAGIEVLERYGMTETVMLAANPLVGDRRAGTVGRPLPGVELRLGADDVVEVRGPNVFTGYLGRPEATAAAFTDDGWFRTGDIGHLGDDGYLSLIGRASELIITGGFNVYPREIEDVLRTSPVVADVAVVGVPDEEWGEIVTAFVVIDDAERRTEAWRGTLEALANQELARFKAPRRWHAVDALPRNAMGKVLRAELVAQAQADAATLSD